MKQMNSEPVAYIEQKYVLDNNGKLLGVTKTKTLKMGNPHRYAHCTPLYLGPQNNWISIKDRLPELKKYVLTICNGIPRVLFMEWERPTYEKTFKSFLVWVDGYATIEHDQVTFWMEIPNEPN